MTISKDNENDNVPQSVDLEDALQQMKEDGTVPDGFHMMFFSEDFSLGEECPMNQLLKMVTMSFNCSETLRRQVYQMPNNKNIITYEFAWIGAFDLIQGVMEEMDSTITDGVKRMIANKTLTVAPKRRIQFLLAMPQEEEIEANKEDEDLF